MFSRSASAATAASALPSYAPGLTFRERFTMRYCSIYQPECRWFWFFMIFFLLPYMIIAQDCELLIVRLGLHTALLVNTLFVLGYGFTACLITKRLKLRTVQKLIFIMTSDGIFQIAITTVTMASNADTTMVTTPIDSGSLEINSYEESKGVFVSSELERILTLSFIITTSVWILLGNCSIIWIRYVSDKLNQEYHHMLSICAFYNIMLVIPGKYWFWN